MKPNIVMSDDYSCVDQKKRTHNILICLYQIPPVVCTACFDYWIINAVKVVIKIFLTSFWSEYNLFKLYKMIYKNCIFLFMILRKKLFDEIFVKLIWKICLCWYFGKNINFLCYHFSIFNASNICFRKLNEKNENWEKKTSNEFLLKILNDGKLVFIF